MAAVRVLDQPGFAPDEFLARWRDARLAALGRWVALPTRLGESAALLAAPAESREELLREVFLNSFRFGQSAVRRFGRAWDAGDLMDVLGAADGPCQRGSWIADDGAWRLERRGCAGASAGALVCDYWREATDGLVCGLSEDVRYSRHASSARGAETCVDVLYREGDPEWRFASLPGELLPALSRIALRFRGHGMELRFLGLAEGQLFYTLTHRGASLCDGALELYASLLRNNLARHCPGLGLREATGRAVAI